MNFKKIAKTNELCWEISGISWIFIAGKFTFFLTSHKKSKTKKNAMRSKYIDKCGVVDRQLKEPA